MSVWRGGSRGGARYRRTQVTAAASVGVLGLSVLLAPSGVAEEVPRSAPESGEIRNGTAKAVATVAKIAPGVGQLELGMTMGTAVTQLTNDLAQATAQTADLGLIGSSLTSEGCDGGATLTPDQLPQPTSVDNREGDASRTRDEAGAEGSPAALGRMHVEAVEDAPASRALASSTSLGSPDVLRIGGGDAEARTRVLPGEGREATASVTSSLSLAGALRLDGMRWDARHRTGTDPLAEGTFELGRAELGGVPLPTEDLATAEAAINEALAQTGISISLPRVQRLVEPADLVRVTPMRIEIRDSPLGKTVLGPALDATRDQRVQLFDDLVALSCDSASALLVGDIAISVASGTGFLTVDLGGVQASSADLEIGNPFGVIEPFEPGDVSIPGIGVGGASSAPGIGAAPVPGISPPSTVAAAPAPRTVPARATGPVEELCESLHPNRSACSDGAAAAVGVVGLLATVGMAGADVARQRRQAALAEDR